MTDRPFDQTQWYWERILTSLDRAEKNIRIALQFIELHNLGVELPPFHEGPSTDVSPGEELPPQEV